MWCERRLLARIHRYTLERLRREIEPVTASEFLQFLACWQHVDEQFRLEGPRGVAEVLRQLAGFEIPAKAWENHVLARRVRDYRREWLDELTLSGEFAWGRLWGAGASAIRVTPISFVPHDDLETWLSFTEQPGTQDLSGPADDVLHALSTRGAMFTQHLAKAADLPPAYVDRGLAELLAHGLVTCDSFASLRRLITPPSRRRRAPRSVGRWSCFRTATPPLPAGKGRGEGAIVPVSVHEKAQQLLAQQLLRRTGVVFRRTLLRERLPITWAELVRIYRRMELRGEVRGGRFVAGFSGEQFALPEAVELLRRLRRDGPRAPVTVMSADPLNFQGILTPDPRIPPTIRQEVLVG
jgi:ATP-dependent Lhr-like helicase